MCDPPAPSHTHQAACHHLRLFGRDKPACAWALHGQPRQNPAPSQDIRLVVPSYAERERSCRGNVTGPELTLDAPRFWLKARNEPSKPRFPDPRALTNEVWGRRLPLLSSTTLRTHCTERVRTIVHPRGGWVLAPSDIGCVPGAPCPRSIDPAWLHHTTSTWSVMGASGHLCHPVPWRPRSCTSRAASNMSAPSRTPHRGWMPRTRGRSVQGGEGRANRQLLWRRCTCRGWPSHTVSYFAAGPARPCIAMHRAAASARAQPPPYLASSRHPTTTHLPAFHVTESKQFPKTS